MSSRITFIGGLPKPVSNEYHIEDLLQLHPIVYLHKTGQISDTRIVKSLRYIEKAINTFGMSKQDITFNVDIDPIFINIEASITFNVNGPTAYSLINAPETLSPFDLKFKQFMYAGHIFQISESIPNYAICTDNFVYATPEEDDTNFLKQVMIATTLFGRKDISILSEITQQTYSDISEYIDQLDKTVYKDISEYVNYSIKRLPNRSIITAYIQCVPSGIPLFNIIESPIFEVNKQLYKATSFVNKQVSINCNDPNIAVLALYVLYDDHQFNNISHNPLPPAYITYRVYRDNYAFITVDVEKPVWM